MWIKPGYAWLYSSNNYYDFVVLKFSLKYLENHSVNLLSFLYKAYKAYILTCIDNESQNSKL
jgi:hypothetical protein